MGCLISSYTFSDEPIYFSDCQSGIEVGSIINDRWISSCESVHRVNNYDPYNPRGLPAKYYTFTLSRDADVRVSITGGYSRHLFLLEGSSISGNPILRFQDSLIETFLPAGTYTIEATSDSFNYNFELALEYNDIGSPECLQSLAIGDSISDGWVQGCESNNRDQHDPYGPRPEEGYRAKYFTFSISEESDVSIDVDSAVNTFIYLLSGSDEFGMPLAAFDINNVLTTLPAGDYTVELTTDRRYAPGQFEISLNVLSQSVECNQSLEFSQVVAGNWTASCVIQSYDHSNSDPYAGRDPERANYYSFTLAETKELNFSRISNRDEILLNLYEEGNFDAVIATTRPSYLWQAPKDSFDVRLNPGSYSLEVTTYNQVAIGEFEFRVIEHSGSSCRSNVSVGFDSTGLLTDGCISAFREGQSIDPYAPQEGTYFAKQFEFTLTEFTNIRAFASLTGESAYLYLAEKDGTQISLLDESAHDYWNTSSSQEIRRTLSPGSYIVEVTTEYPERLARIRL